MTREQLDAIRVRAAELGTCMTETTLLLVEVERLTAERDTAFQRGVAAMRVAALNVIDCDETEWRCHGDLHAERILALPDPEDK